jgi:hypothetical protein
VRRNVSDTHEADRNSKHSSSPFYFRLARAGAYTLLGEISSTGPEFSLRKVFVAFRAHCGRMTGKPEVMPADPIRAILLPVGRPLVQSRRIPCAPVNSEIRVATYTSCPFHRQYGACWYRSVDTRLDS